MEQALSGRRARKVMIETSSTSIYAGTRADAPAKLTDVSGITRQWILHGNGINLQKLVRWQLDYPDPNPPLRPPAGGPAATLRSDVLQRAGRIHPGWARVHHYRGPWAGDAGALGECAGQSALRDRDLRERPRRRRQRALFLSRALSRGSFKCTSTFMASEKNLLV